MANSAAPFKALDAFKIHRDLIEDYRQFTEGFVEISDQRLAQSVRDQSDRGAQWPDPWLSLNPTFAGGGTVDDLVSNGSLLAATAALFRLGGKPLSLYQHQVEAITAASQRNSYVLTTGTGSGKSLGYIIPIVDYVLRHRRRAGIKAIIVYPMNALANSQVQELEKFLGKPKDGGEGIAYKRYTGQEQEDERERILARPPDILLTNYVMLELLLTRPAERAKLFGATSHLQFLVLDELHTYRGRQGADVAMLVRRVREASQAKSDLQCIGTSATMSTAATADEQRVEVAAVASQVFGTLVRPENVISETLVRATNTDSEADLGPVVDARGTAESNDPRLSAGYAELSRDPLAAWIERKFGLAEEAGSGILVRGAPTTVKMASIDLAAQTGRLAEACRVAIQQTLLAGARAVNPVSQRPLFAFRLHQFISKGASVYVTLEPEASRAIEHEYQMVLPGPAGNAAAERRLYPLAFCRDCGQEYLMVERDQQKHAFVARRRMQIRDERDGYLYVDTKDPWPGDPIDRIPDVWTETSTNGTLRVIPSRRERVPQAVTVNRMGEILEPDDFPNNPDRLEAAWIPKGLLFCLRCGTTYHQARALEASKVATLDQEGRSSAMTVLSLSILKSLEQFKGLPKDVKKLLTFVDNRQDASLQAGHVNDFVLVGQLRAAIRAASAHAGAEGLDPLEYAQTLPQYLGLEPSHYAQNPYSFDIQPAKRALAKVVEYRALQDLRRGWRITLPNLEQTGLAKIAYPTAMSLCQHDKSWDTAHPLLRTAHPDKRKEFVTVMLDEFRRVLAIDTDLFGQDHVDQLQRLSREHLTGVWTVEDGEPAPDVGYAVLGAKPSGSSRSVLSISRLSLLGRWLARQFDPTPGGHEVEAIQESLVKVLTHNGILATVAGREETGYRLKLHQIKVLPSDGKYGAPDPLRRTNDRESGTRVVEYFQQLYLDAGSELSTIQAREHTAQVRAEDREKRERLFREGELKLLYCSPTMELGVDIASLNTVAMRNVPPTPANYAQRSGRAGRSGQPALALTYCASGNAHDSYYFKRSDQMVSGRVLPPRIDLANEDLVRSHVHSIWLAASGASLGKSMRNVVAIPAAGDDYPVVDELIAKFTDPTLPQRASQSAHAVLDPMAGDLGQAPWWSDTWVDDVVRGAPAAFDQACQRWRMLDRVTRGEMETAAKMIQDTSLNKKERQNAENRMTEARRQRDLLLNDTDEAHFGGDFYPYRYFASEGFLPGYSFPRLPLAAYIPGRQNKEATWLQRPRFLALREFGPGAFIYHEGARYKVVRINLPRPSGKAGEQDGNVSLRQVRVCDACGYHHDREIGVDLCQNCGAMLGDPMTNLLPMQLVITRRRDRIGADEEERQRAGFSIATSYRFTSRGNRPASLQATVTDHDGPVATIQYGDAAELRSINRGHRRRATGTDGFWLDTVRGEWLSDSRAAALDVEGEDDDAPRADDVPRKQRVIPFVEDRRNIAIMRWAEPVSDALAVTLMNAVERGIETVFQLEDSELTTELLPDSDKLGRFMIVEAAEGGAGVLRRVQGEEDAIRRVAKLSLEIIHVDPATGEDEPDACVRGCYRCLLTYGNQNSHELIDRRLAVPLLLRLLDSRTLPDTAGQTPPPPPPNAATPSPKTAGPVEKALAYLMSHGLNQPSKTLSTVEGVHVDLVFPQARAVVVFADMDRRRDLDLDPLTFSGWDVMTWPPNDPFEELVAAHPSVFGCVD
ncbi:MAG: DEAD/DEAH box helicase [Bifidobacteriaceae bacterium]|jgi:superfamily II DNA/RNA helicase|nr:DEAD/DEAH box helicase [Bifidobacteriaceae bacterium]